MKAELSPLESMAKSNAAEAIDQRAAYETLTDCLDSYWCNVNDTALEMGCKSGPDFENLFTTYRKWVRLIATSAAVALPGDYR